MYLCCQDCKPRAVTTLQTERLVGFLTRDEILLLYNAARQAIGPAQLPVQSVLRTLWAGLMQPVKEVDQSPQVGHSQVGHIPRSNAEVKHECVYNFTPTHAFTGGTRWRSWSRYCATCRKVAGSIPDGVTGIFQ